MTDRELLEFAAKAAGIELQWHKSALTREAMPTPTYYTPECGNVFWNPLDDDGDALRLAVKRGFHVSIDRNESTRILDEFDGVILVHMHFECGPEVATRRAIVRAAAEIGKALP